jgi:DNA-binding beta-propeller fold protein YncE
MLPYRGSWRSSPEEAIMLRHRHHHSETLAGFGSASIAGLACVVLAMGCGEDPTGQIEFSMAPGACQLLVSDMATDGVHRFDPYSGQLLGMIQGSQLREAEGLVDVGGQLYVASYWSGKVVRYDLGTEHFMVVSDAKKLMAPTGMIVGPDGAIYVAGYSSDNVVRFDPQTQGSTEVVKKGGVKTPQGLAFGPDGSLYVASVDTNQVLKFSPGGTLLKSIGPVYDPFGIAFGPDGNLYVASAETGSVLRFDGQTGAPLGTFVAPGAGGLQFPYGVAFGPDAKFYVSDYFGAAILRYDAATGAYLDTLASGSASGLQGPTYFTWTCPSL